MFNYIPEFFKGETADNDEEADRWYADKKNNRRTAGPAAARRGRPRHQLRGQGGPGHARTAACSSTSARGAPADYITQAAAVHVPPVQGAGGRRHHQGADGGRPDLPLRDGRRAGRRRLHRGARCPASSRPARSPAACTAPTASAATRSPTCWCSAGAPGCTPRSTPRTSAGSSRSTRAQVESIARADRSSPSSARAARTPTPSRPTCRRRCRTWSGIIRTEAELKEALKKIEGLKQRAGQGARGGRPRPTTPAGTPRSTCSSLLTVAECCDAGGARAQGEPRRPHPRRPSRTPTTRGATINVVLRQRDGRIAGLRREPLPEMPAELKALFQERK